MNRIGRIRDRLPPLLLGVAALTAGAYGIFGAFFRDAARQGILLWDLDYYRTAAGRWTAGLDPYLSEAGATGYFYSPSATPLIAWLFDGFRAETLYTLLMAAAIAATLALAVGAARPPRATLALCWLYAIAFGNAEVVYLLAAGNLAWFCGLLQAASLWAAARGAWVPFYLLVGTAGLVKPQSLVLLIVPWVLRRISFRALIALAPLAADAILSRLLWPGLAASRSEAIWQLVIEPLQLRYTIAGRLSRLLAAAGLEPGPATVAAYAAQLAVVAVLVLVLRSRRRDGPAAFSLAVVAAFAALPRMAGYDAYLYAPAVFAGFLPWTGRGVPRRVAIAAGLTLLAPLLKEGLAVLPLLATATVFGARGLPDRSPERTQSE